MMSTEVRLRDIMVTSVLTFSPAMEINQALDKLIVCRYSGAPVIGAHGLLAGVLSQKDCLKAVLNTYYHHTLGGTVADYMTTHVETLQPDMELVEVAHRFINSSYRRFPVVEHTTLVGQVSRSDVLRSLNKQWS